MNYVLVQSATQYYAASPRPASRGETGVPFYSLSPAVSQARIQRRLPTRAGGFSLPSLLPPSATQAGSGSGSPRQQQPSHQQQQRVLLYSRENLQGGGGFSSRGGINTPASAVTSDAMAANASLAPPSRRQLVAGPLTFEGTPAASRGNSHIGSRGGTPGMAVEAAPRAAMEMKSAADRSTEEGSTAGGMTMGARGPLSADENFSASFSEGSPAPGLSTPAGGGGSTPGGTGMAGGLWKRAGELVIDNVIHNGAGERRARRRGSRRPAGLFDVLSILTRDGSGNRWQSTVMSEGFQALVARRRRLLNKLVSVLRTGIVSTQRKLEILSPLPLFRGLARHEILKIARSMTLKLLGRYNKVLRAGSPPAAYCIVLWGSLKYATIGPAADGDVVSAGGEFGNGALSDIIEVEPAGMENVDDEKAADGAAGEETGGAASMEASPAAQGKGLDRPMRAGGSPPGGEDEDERQGDAILRDAKRILSVYKVEPENAAGSVGGGGGGGGGAAGAKSREVQLEKHDLQATEPTLLLCLKPNDMANGASEEDCEWFAALQRRYVNSELKSQMIQACPGLTTASMALCRQLAELFTLQEHPVGHELYAAGERPDSVCLVTHGSIRLLIDPLPPPKMTVFTPEPPPPAPVVVSNRHHTGEVPWVGEEALFLPVVTKGARYTHRAVVSSPCQLLVLPRAHFQKFEKLAPSIVARLNLEFRRLSERIEHTTAEEEDALVHLTHLQTSGMARELMTTAHLRYRNISQRKDHFIRAQRKDEKARFITGLVTAYGRGDVPS